MVAGYGLQALAPSYVEVPNSYQGDPAVCTPSGVKFGVSLGDARLQGVTVLVDVPDEDVTNNVIDIAKVKQRYPNHPLIASGAIK